MSFLPQKRKRPMPETLPGASTFASLQPGQVRMSRPFPENVECAYGPKLNR